MVTPVRGRVPAHALLLLVCSLLALAAPSSVSAATLYVYAGGDLQAALNAAQPGDEVVVQAGARFVGNFVLPAKTAGAVITVRSSSSLPARRITPADAPLMPTLVSPTVEPALIAVNTANWKLDGIRFESTKDGLYNVVYIQDAVNITLDRMLLVGGPLGQRRGIMGNGRQITLTRSHIANIWRNGEESQAFCAWDGAGPYTLTDNYLEAASQGAMFGGANSRSADRIPSDILVEGNHVRKPAEWRGTARVVKNLFELKSARRVVIRNNLFEGNWTDAQNGYAILFTVRNDEGGSPWSVVEDVLFEQNVVRDTENGINVLGYDSYQPSGRATRITIRHNLVVATGNFLQAGSEVGVLTIDHNTIVQGYNLATAYKGMIWAAGASAPRAAEYAVETLKFTNNLTRHNDYGFIGEDAGIGTSAIVALTRGYTWTHNVLAGEAGWGQSYPVVTWQPSLAEHQAQFNADHTLVTGSTYRGAGTDALDLGRVVGNVVTPGGPAPTEPTEPTEPPAPPAPPVDADGPSVVITSVGKNPNTWRFRIEATDPSGVSEVKVWFNNGLVTTTTKVPVEVNIASKNLKPGSYLLVVIATDGIGNATTINRTITK
jgi:hypothetical protein